MAHTGLYRYTLRRAHAAACRVSFRVPAAHHAYAAHYTHTRALTTVTIPGRWAFVTRGQDVTHHTYTTDGPTYSFWSGLHHTYDSTYTPHRWDDPVTLPGIDMFRLRAVVTTAAPLPPIIRACFP